MVSVPGVLTNRGVMKWEHMESRGSMVSSLTLKKIPSCGAQLSTTCEAKLMLC